MRANRLIWILTICCGAALATSNPVPLVNQPLVPDSALPGGHGFTLTVNGTGFASGAVIKWNGHTLATTFVSQSQLTGKVPASYIQKPETASVAVANPAPGGGTSNVAYFSVALPSPGITVVANQFNQSNPIALNVGGDFNGDGKLDVAGFSNGSEILVSLGNGDGTFQQPVSTPFMGCCGMVTGDFNNDGKLDLAFASGSEAFSVVLGKGDGTFIHQRSYSVGDLPALAVGDFNADGKLDIVASNFRDSEVSVYLGNGDGTFQKRIIIPTGDSPTQIAVGDFNGDGKLDLAVVELNSFEVTVLLGQGDGTFVIVGEYFLNDWPGQVVTADVNGDGKLDLIASAYNYIQEFLGNGDGTFRDSKTIWKTEYRYPFYPMNVADMDARDKQDVVSFAYLKDGLNLMLFNGNGNGTFQHPQQSLPDVNFPQNVGPAVLGDFNNDGRPDLIISTYNQAQDVALLQSPGVLIPALLDFGTELIGGKSLPKSIKLTNTGVTSLRTSSIKIVGQDASDFSQKNDCPASLPSLSSCKIRVTFSPTQENREKAEIRIRHGKSVSSESVPLFGRGTVIRVSPLNLNFGDVKVGHESSPKRITLTNTSKQDMQLNKIYIQGPVDASFIENNNCGSHLRAGHHCEINVTFIPSSGGRKSAKVISEFSNDTPPAVELKGTGTR